MSSQVRGDPPRLQIRTADNLEGAVPTVRRMDPRTANFSSSFNDTSVVIFETTSVSYPQILSTSSLYLSTSYLVAPGRVVKGVSDSNILRQRSLPSFGPYVEAGGVNLSEDTFFMTGSISDDRLSCRVRDKVAIKIDIDTTSDALFTRAKSSYTSLDPSGSLAGRDVTGFSYYNFRLRRWEMVGLSDPETGQATHFDWQVRPSVDPQDVVSGTESFPSQFVPYHGTSPTWSGDAPTSSVTSGQMYEISRRRQVGSPTVSSFAPFGNKYHASGSQTLRMSQFINQPFLLEKVVVNLPIRAERRSDSAVFFSSSNYTVPQEDYVFFIYRQEQSYFPTSSESLEGFGPIPQRSTHRQKAVWATGSMRYLVCSGVMTFYNNVVRYPHPAASSSGVQVLTGYRPLNTPAFMHDWNVGTSSNPASPNAANFTGSVTLNIPVAVASPHMSTDYCYYSSNTSVKRAKVQHYWPGGTTALPFGPNNISGKQLRGQVVLGASGEGWLAQGSLVNEPPFGKPTFTFYGDSSGVPNFSEAKTRLRIEKFDPRTTKILGGLNVSSGSTSGQQSAVSPYLLLPEDEIVLGIEAALPTLSLLESGSGAEYGSLNNVTGSQLRVVPGNATLTLYGSTLRGNDVYDSGRPQYLTSEAISEAISEDVYDQFFIPSRERLAGSIRDFTMTGSFFESVSGSVRKLLSIDSTVSRHLVTNNDTIVTFDLVMNNIALPPSQTFENSTIYKNQTTVFSRRQQRLMRITSENERYYDSITPSVERYLADSGASNTGSYISSSGTPSVTIPEVLLNAKIYKFTAGSNTFACLEKHRNGVQSTLESHPYRSNPERPLVERQIYLALSRSVNAPYCEFLITNQDLLRMIVFTRGYVFSKFSNFEVNTGVDNLPSYQHDLTGSTQNKYGIQSYMPIFSGQVFRVDRYGQFRDRLEQRKFGVFYDVIGLSDSGRLTGRKGKKVGPVSIRFKTRAGRYVPPSLAIMSGSSNRSLEATSSLPYIDGEYTNWSNVF